MKNKFQRILSGVLSAVLAFGMLPQFTLPIRAAKAVAEFDIKNLRFDDRVEMSGKSVEIIDAGTPTSYQVGYGVEENAVLDTAVVTMKGNTLVATGIGTAKVKIDGEIYEITVTAAPISLLLLAGQSNMQGSEGDENQSIVCPDGMVYSTYGDRYTMTTANATNFAPSALTGSGSDLNVNGTTTNLEDWPIYLLNERGVGKKGPDSGFAYEWVKQTGEKVWVVNAAHGGSSINTWQKTGENYKEALALFTACQETLRKEIAAGHYTLSHMGYFWCQGCTDYSQTAEWYVNKYLTMHENFKTQMAFDHDSNPDTSVYQFEFGGIIPVRAGNESYTSYRQGIYADTTSKAYYESFKDLRFTGPRVAQYWMCNNPDLPDIWNVCNIGEDWVWMPDGTNGVTEYFQSRYPNGTVDYTTQVPQAASWYTPTTPAAVHDSIHYNQIGYNEVGRESARNALIMLGEIEAPEVETTVEFLSWDGYTTVDSVTAATTGASGTLVVPKVYPVWKSKEVTYQLSDGLIWNYYDLLVEDAEMSGTLLVDGMNNSVNVKKGEPYQLFVEHLAGLPDNVCSDLNLWSVLEHDKYYFANGTNWGIHSSGDVPSVTIFVNPGDRIYATSFGKAGENGHTSTSGIRTTFFSEYGIAKTMTPAEVYAEFKANGGYLVAPEGAVAINIPMWNNSDANELYILSAEHDYTAERVCSICGSKKTSPTDGHLSELPEKLCAETNLWTVLEHDKEFYSPNTGWHVHSSGTVFSVTIPVNPGDKVFATSFGAAGVNGGSANGIRVVWFSADGMAKSTDPAKTYAEFTKNGGYLIAPEGAVAINIPMWNNSDSNEIYILSRDHTYKNGICTGCGAKMPAPQWECGTIAAADGLNGNNSTRIRTVDYLRLSDFAGVAVNLGYQLTWLAYDANKNYIGNGTTTFTGLWQPSGQSISTEEIQRIYANAVYFRVALKNVSGSTVTLEAVEASGVTFLAPGEALPKPDYELDYQTSVKIGSWQDGAIWDGKLFVLGASGSGAVFDLQSLKKLTTFTLDNKDILKPHANSVCFGSTYYAEGDKYPLLYVNVYNNYASAADRMEGTCCVYRVTEENGLFTTELVQVIRIGFTEDLTLWKSKENKGDVRPYGNFLVDTDHGKLYAYVMRDANSTTRFFCFDLPTLADGQYNETYGCNVVTLGKESIERYFDTEYFKYLQGGTYSSGMIVSVEGFTSGGSAEPAIRVVDLETGKIIAMYYVANSGLTAEPEVVSVDPATGLLYYAAADGVLRVVEIPNVHFHAYTTTITAPTCTEQGYTTYTCACGDSYVDDYVDAKGHTYKNGICAVCQRVSPLYGKNVSILGDSISTFAGVSKCSSPYYNGSNRDVQSVYDTWWGKLIEDHGMSLCVNYSQGGVAMNNPVIYNDRVLKLHTDRSSPDVIFVFLGHNDKLEQAKPFEDIRWSTIIQENADGTYTYTEPDSFTEAYVIAVHKMLQKYPAAEVVLLQCLTTGTSEKYNQINQIIQAIGDKFGLTVVDFYGNGLCRENKTYFPGDVHPSKAGMNKITDILGQVLESIHLHSFNSAVTLPTCTEQGYTTYTCECGDKYVADEVVATGHAWSDWKVIAEPQWDVPGTKERTCANCRIAERENIPAQIEMYPDILHGHLQQMPENVFAHTNLWQLLQPEDVYFYAGTHWGTLDDVVSVTIPICAGDQIYASSFQRGIRVAFFDKDGLLVSLTSGAVKEEFAQNGYITAPEGAIAVNVPMWDNSSDNVLRILTLKKAECTEHQFGSWKTVTEPGLVDKGTAIRHCEICGDSQTEEIPERMQPGYYLYTDDTTDIELPYRIYVPASADSNTKYPVVIFYHGAGSRGTDNRAQVLGKSILNRLVALNNCIIIAPQCPTGKQWVNTPWGNGSYDSKSVERSVYLDASISLLDEVIAKPYADTDRVYAIGLSMGGYATWNVMMEYPEKFAAVVPICGAADPGRANEVLGVAVWAFHGDVDTTVPVSGSREMIEAIRALGGIDVRYTEYKDVGHASWDKAFAEPELTDWLFAQKKHSHSYTSSVTAPTCTEQGYTTHTCACGESYVDSYTEKSWHSYDNGSCAVCGCDMLRVSAEDLLRFQGGVNATNGILNTTFTNNWYVDIPVPAGAEQVHCLTFKTGGTWGSAFYSGKTYLSGHCNVDGNVVWQTVDVPENATTYRYGYLYDEIAENAGRPRFEYLEFAGKELIAVEPSGFSDRPQTGCESFRVTVNIAPAMGAAGGYVEGTDYGYIQLPTNYSAYGEPTRLIIVCHGAGASLSNYQSNAWKSNNYSFWMDLGYAVMDMYACPQELSGSTSELHYGNPVVVDCYKAGYDYVMEKYNLCRDGVYVLGSSMGGLSSFQIVQSGRFPVRGQIAYCPVIDLFKQAYCNPWTTPSYQREKIATYFGFEGTAPAFTGSKFPSEAEIAYYRQNLAKTVSYSPILRNVTAGDISGIFEVIPRSATETNAAEQALYDQLTAQNPCPIIIFHNTNDATVSYRYSQYFVDMLGRSGQEAIFHTYNSGGHNAWANGASYTVSGLNGNITIKETQYEAYLFVNELEMHQEHYPWVDPAVDASCTTAGLSEGSHCAVCGEILTKQEVIPTKGHTFENGVCTICGANALEYISTTEGTYINSSMKNAAPDSATPSYCIDKYRVTPGCQIQIVARIGQAAYCAWVDADGNRTKALQGNSNSGVNISRVLTVPNGAVYLEVSYSINYEHYIGEYHAGESYGAQIGLLGDSIAANGGFLNTMVNKLCLSSGKNVAVGGWFYSEDTGVNGEYPGDATHGIYRQIQNLTGNENLIVLWAGTNDFGHSHKIGTMFNDQGQLNVDVTTFYGGMNRVITDLHNKFGKDIPIIICTPLHRNMPDKGTAGYPYSSESANKLGYYLSDYVEAMLAIADYYDLLVFDSDVETKLNPNDESINSKYFSDGLHPNTAGHTVIGEKLVQFIVKNLSDRLGYSYKAIVTAPTCTEQGYTTYTCACGHSYKDSFVTAKGHTPVINKAVAPTCTANGLTEGKHCSVCGEVLKKQEVVPAKGHSYESVVTAPTCTEQGYTTRTCACGHSYKDSFLEAKGHTPVIDKAVAPTCTETGLTEGKHCSTCGELLKKQEVIPEKGHTPVVDKAVAPTCTATGLTDGTKCGNCGEILTAQTVIPTKGHTTVIDKAVAPTCTETGLTEGKHCSTCGEVLKKQEIVAAKGHSYTSVVTVPTCTEQGYTTHTCACGHSYKDSFVEAKGHSYTSVVTVPTCTEQGYTTHTCACGHSYKDSFVAAKGHAPVIDKAVVPTCTATGLTEGKHCSVCGEVLKKQEAIPAKGHTPVVDKAVAPTCTATGLTEGKHCSVCGEVLKKQEVVAAKGHSYTSVVTVPTCTEQGYTTHTCACGHSYQDSFVAAKGHTIVTDKAVAPTCTATGLTEGKHCSVCGEILAKQEIIPAKGHSYTSAITVPTCTEQGYTTYTCACGDSYQDSFVEAKGHTTVIDNAVAPTCTETGLTEGKHCSTCGEVLKKQEIVPAKGHSYTSAITAPTCTEQGYTTHTCACGHSYKDSFVEAKGHTTVIDKAVAPTCTETGLTEGKHCSVCGEVLKKQEAIPAKGHSYTSVVTAPTCTEQGYTTHTCACGHSYKDSFVEPKGHTPVTDKAVVPTCTATGLTEGKHCSTCGEVLKKQEIVPATGHTPIIDPAVAETCTTSGLTEGQLCGVCRQVLKKQEVIPAKGHSFTDYIPDGNATVDADGTKTAHCDHGCGAVDTVADPGSKLPPEKLSSDTFEIAEGWLRGIAPGMPVEALLGGVLEENVRVLKGGVAVEPGTTVGTGMVIQLLVGETVVDEARVVVAGDVNGDGAVSITDMLSVKAHLLKKTELTGAAAEAANINSDSGISITDFLQIKAILLRKS